MLKRLAIVGVALLLAGSAVQGWVYLQRQEQKESATKHKPTDGSDSSNALDSYNEWLQLPPQERDALPPALSESLRTKTEAELAREQKARLKADLDKLANDESLAPPFADLLYGENWREELGRYRTSKEQHELAFTISMVCASIGGSIFGGCLLLRLAQLLARILSWLTSRHGRADTGDPECSDGQEQAGQESAEDTPPRSAKAKQLPQTEEVFSQSSVVEKSPERSGSFASRASVDNHNDDTEEEPELSARGDGDRAVRVERDGPSDAESDGLKTNLLPLRLVRSTRAHLLGRADRWPAESQDRCEGRVCVAEEEPEQSTEEDVDTDNQGTARRAGPDPLNSTLTELNQQMAAIREYASDQQNRVKRLQEGYDWNIIRNFCLRVIRCIDNLDSRIAKQAEEENDMTHLTEVRDELVFALESSGIEQFEPEIHSEYRGQERLAEAVKERQHGEDPDLAGKIAEVVRPGYQYFIDEENVKVVRPAMVKLFA
jgi:molecular chaperone GrpE (heat shock protein)